MTIVNSATTIGSNIQSDGTASTTSATTTAYMMVGVDFTLPDGFDYSGDFAVSGDAVINGVATSTTALWVGTGSPTSLDHTGGDLYVQGASEFDGAIRVDGAATFTALATFTSVTSTSATTTAYMMVGSDFALPASFDYADGDLAVSGNAVIKGVASTTDDMIVAGGTFDLTSQAPTTTAGIFSRAITATSTLSAGNLEDTLTVPGCLEMVREGAYYACWINTAGTGVECAAGRCVN